MSDVASESDRAARVNAAGRLVDDYSIEITPKDVASLRDAAPGIAPGTAVSVTFLATDTLDQRIAAATQARALGFEPMPHLSARRIESLAELEATVSRATAHADARRMFLVAGDPPVPAGPFADTMALVRTGLFERHGVRVIGIAGHPERHAVMDEAMAWRALADKDGEIRARGMTTLIVTQFGFDAAPFLAWLTELRSRGIDAPVRIGVPGPAGIKTLLRFAATCGVGASASVMAKYGLSITKLLGTAGPDRLIEALADGIEPAHGDVRLHFYPFGGVGKTMTWINDYLAATDPARRRH
ncbi:methylenetetrahydrofolate reductase [Sphingomonas bacterium]|uniref:methylenetetrahydrofolate reductase n=1 Tax=Sphingomonas bacterium TaxID=1895847 RepID=UPI001575C8F3|nr:methylenetetrahydrofolate reductase [Sphingomonas bacterium]